MISLLAITDFIGRLHPLFVHLPIGILLMACLFQLLTISEKFRVLQPAVPVLLVLGAISAIGSCISGYLLSRSGDYDEVLSSRHQWMGISVALVALVFYILYKKNIAARAYNYSSALLIVLIMITGHMGGSLTHGSSYLTEGWGSEGQDSGPVLDTISNVQEAAVYADMVQPILEARCYSCHGPEKRKGKLRLDTQDFILKGGEHGNTVVAGKPDESKLIERLLLPPENDDHMPPVEKPQLTQQEIDILHWWIGQGMDFTKKVKDMEQTAKIKPVLQSLQTGTASTDTREPEVPAVAANKADDKVIDQLKKTGVVILPVAQNSNYLSVNFVTADDVSDNTMKLLESIKDQLLWLKLDRPDVTDKTLLLIQNCKKINRLHLAGSQVTDKGMSVLSSLEQLQIINLTGTKVTAAGVRELQKIKTLKNIYLYQSAVSRNDWPGLVKLFPQAKLDSGNYVVPTTAKDTTEIKF